MDFKIKQHTSIKKQIFKKDSLIFFFKKTETNVQIWNKIKQKKEICNIIFVNIFNKISNKLSNNSIIKSIKPIISCVNMLFRLNLLQLFNKMIINYLQSTASFILLAIKLDNKIYSSIQLKKTFILSYISSKLLLFKVIVVNFKKSQ